MCFLRASAVFTLQKANFGNMSAIGVRVKSFLIYRKKPLKPSPSSKEVNAERHGKQTLLQLAKSNVFIQNNYNTTSLSAGQLEITSGYIRSRLSGVFVVKHGEALKKPKG